MALTGWKTGGKETINKDGIEYLYLKRGSTYTVRLLKDPILMAKYFYLNNGKTRVAIISPSDRDNCPIRAKYPDKLKNPASLRYAVRIIDRKDSKIKVMEFPYSVYKSICEQAEHHNVDPGAKDGADFTIKVAAQVAQDMYTTLFDGATVLTKEEITSFKECEDKTDLEKLYKIDSMKEVEQKLFGEFSDKKEKTNFPNSSEDNVNFSEETESTEDILF